VHLTGSTSRARWTTVASILAVGVCTCAFLVTYNTNLSPVELALKISNAQHAHKVHKELKKGLGLKHSDLSLLASAMADQTAEKHSACLKECTTKACKDKCGAIAAGKKATAAKPKIASHKKGLGLKKSDLSLLKDAEKARRAEEAKHCAECVTADCKARCASVAAARKTHVKKAAPKKKVNLGLKASDLKLLQDAEKRQGREEKMIKQMHAHDAKFLQKHSSLKAIDDINHQPGDADGDGDWAPGMRSSALAQLKEEESEAAKTARETEGEDEDSTY